MKKGIIKRKNISELRQDLVSGDWVVVATGRAKRPDVFASKEKRFHQLKTKCPFENPEESNKVKALIKYNFPGDHTWFVQVIPNKFPAFGKGICMYETRNGPYSWMDGVGFHEVIITRDHKKSLADFSIEEAELVVRAYQNRYLALKDADCIEYISIFHNHGSRAGASISHPHSQLIAIPVIPPDVGRSVIGSKNYYERNKKCVHCVMIDWERRKKERIIFENERFIAFCPFASRTAFEVRIFPKNHSPQFELISDIDRRGFSEALAAVLKKIHKGLNDPDYNFFIHTSPCNLGAYHYHWHLEILPKTAIWAGFELSTGIEISTAKPEEAAAYLRKIETRN